MRRAPRRSLSARALLFPGLRFFCFLALSLGCAKVPSVRAQRRFAREPSRLDVVDARTRDFEKAIALSKALLQEVPWRSGDRWPSRLSLAPGEEDRLRAKLRRGNPYRDRDFAVPPLAIWVLHVEAVVDAARRESPEGRSPGIARALAASSPAGQRILALLESLDEDQRVLAAAGARVGLLRQASRSSTGERESGETAEALADAESDRDAAKARIVETARALADEARDLRGVDRTLARDFQSAVSVAYRLVAEAGALRAVLDREAMLALPRPDARARRRLRTAASALARPDAQADPAPGVAETIAIPQRLGAASARTAALETVYDRLGAAVEHSAHREMDDTPGVASGDTLVDDVAGFAWESLSLAGRAGGDVTFFSNLVDQTTDPESDSDVRFDYSARRRFLKYRVQPVVLVGASAEASVSLFSMPKFLRFNFGWSTDRFFRSGGQVSGSSSAASELGIRGRVSELVEAVLHLGGVDTSVKVARFDFGEVDVVDARSNRIVDTFPFQLEELQLDVTYDLRHFVDAAWLVGVVDSIEVGFRYLEYRLPRILYEMEDQNPDPDVDEYTLVGETDFVQNIDSRYFMGGFRVRTFDDPSTTSRLVLDFGFYAGAGPSRFAYPTEDDERTQTLLALMIPVRVGYRLPLLPASSAVQLDLVAAYAASLVHANTVGEGNETASGEDGESDQGTRVIRFGSTDFFHGPSLWLKGTL